MTLTPEIAAALQRASTATITTVLLKKGIRRVWMRGPMPLAERGGNARRRAGLHAALRAGARRPGDAGILVLAEIDARRDRGDAGGRAIAVVDAHGRHGCRHLRRHPLRPHGEAGRRGAGHRRRRARPRRRARRRACRSGAPACAAPPSVAGLTFVGWQEPIGCGGVAVFPDDIIVADGDGAVVIPAALVDEVAAGAEEQERLEAWIMGEVEKGAALPGLYPPNAETKARDEKRAEIGPAGCAVIAQATWVFAQIGYIGAGRKSRARR